MHSPTPANSLTHTHTYTPLTYSIMAHVAACQSAKFCATKNKLRGVAMWVMAVKSAACRCFLKKEGMKS